MRLLDKVHTLFAFLFCRKQTAQRSAPPNQDQKQASTNKEAFSQGGPENCNNDSFGGLSEAAAPEPVEQPQDEEGVHAASLEQQLSKNARQVGKNEGDRAWSEVAAPQLVRRRSDERQEAHTLLEDQPTPLESALAHSRIQS